MNLLNKIKMFLVGVGALDDPHLIICFAEQSFLNLGLQSKPSCDANGIGLCTFELCT